MTQTPTLLVCTAKDQDDWRRAVSALLPEAIVRTGIDAPPCDYVIVWKPPAELFAAQTRLKAIFSLGAGVDGLLAMPALPADVPLVRMEDGGMAPQMIEYALYVALRRLRRFGDYERSQAQASWSPRPARPRGDLRIGVLGLGVLGGEVARALAQFGFRVSGWSRTPKSIQHVACESGDAGLTRMLAHSEVLLVFLPSTPATQGLIGRDFLRMLPAGACIANLSRGEILDEAALLAALDDGRIDEAHLDVFAHEPLPPAHPLWRHARVRVTPHIAALTDPVIAAEQVVGKIRRLQAGLPITGVVDRRQRY
ncbi:glyoxylate/hydroxypyruvate reductase A [Lysobacter sp. K5869]|uniref:NAD(P)-dependent oxidoreductase n=1 Tax=Lysobacter sp. K5869 TaxID=2820808 RepID=UPI001C06290B|nr:NAD(P)-dependent oxidoreductase [Lysobacter sp. K5869]QWP75363.1 glyoxylate/hydroxypyruvate reductase A [Lysobacter sp. K5869]